MDNNNKFFDKRVRNNTLMKNKTERHKLYINGNKEKMKIPLHVP